MIALALSLGAEVAPDYWVTVCASCRRACCWHGLFMCHEQAGTTDVRASQLREENNEHPDYYTRERLLEVCGEVKPCL